ncbi:MAG: TonB-dependent receptor [Nitrospirae bacterium]|nr:MAG: TonB-dependent receptor [Nitrospirota bacterium]
MGYVGCRMVCALFLLTCMFPVSIVFSGEMSEQEKKLLKLYFSEEELIESTTRSLKLATQAAENVVVITSEDIERTNAKTLADVLNSITGVQILTTGWGGSAAPLYMQGSEQRHVAAYLDGAILSNNAVDAGSIPVQMIDKIEIIKGPASSAWGSSLGGVINIFTKTGASFGKNNGTLIASQAEKGTGDYRSEIYGELGSFNYYMTGGKMISDGLTPHSGSDGKNFYGKFGMKLSRDLQLSYTSWYADADRMGGESEQLNIIMENPFKKSLQTVSLDIRPAKEFKINASVRMSNFYVRSIVRRRSTGADIQNLSPKDSGYGASLKTSYQSGMHNAVLGTDLDVRALEDPNIDGGLKKQKKWSVFLNDTVSSGDIAVTPGVRYDHVGTANPYVSSSLGIAYKASSATVIRGYTSKGFSAPPMSYTYVRTTVFVPNRDLKNEQVVSYQAGVETISPKYFWLKLSGFRHDIKDSITTEQVQTAKFTYANKERRRRQGIEAEIKTLPVYDTALILGGTFIDNLNLETRKVQKNTPRYTYDVALKYDDKKSMSAVIRGHYIWWEGEAATGGQYNDTIFDFMVHKTMYKHKASKIEAYGSVNNILNGRQFAMALYPNPNRWVEFGMKYSF